MTKPRLVLFPLGGLAPGEWWEHLTTAELAQAQSLFNRQLVRFVNSRIAVRLASSEMLGAHGDALSIRRDAFGKLSVTAGQTLCVSVTYGEDVGIAALSCNPIGIDYESGPAPAFWTSAVRRYCCPCEQRWLASQPDWHKGDAFVWLWTRREAVLKYLGTGIRGECRCLCNLAPRTVQSHFRVSPYEGIGTLISGVQIGDIETRVIGLGLPAANDLLLFWMPAGPDALNLNNVHS